MPDVDNVNLSFMPKYNAEKYTRYIYQCLGVMELLFFIYNPDFWNGKMLSANKIND